MLQYTTPAGCGSSSPPMAATMASSISAEPSANRPLVHSVHPMSCMLRISALRSPTRRAISCASSNKAIAASASLALEIAMEARIHVR